LLADVVALGWPHVLLRLAVAGALGAAVGVERELREREAGLRTHLLVSLGSALFTLVSAYGFSGILAESGSSVLVRLDPSRIAAQIVSGIGFLGAGAIIRQGLSIRGLTTAATLWVVAAIGMASGAGYYSAAIITTAVALFTLGPLRIYAYRLLNHYRPEAGRLLVQLPAGESPGPLVTEVERLGADIHSIEISHEADRRNIALDLALPHGGAASELVAKVADVDQVLEVQWAD
jgi:putative Mg2+ transporter-C (MgtC) family protein